MKRIVAIGDIHGSIGALLEIAQRLALINGGLEFQAENTEVVFIGDLCDRGENTKDLYELVIGWQKEAPAIGSRVWFLLGNHEVMNAYGLTHYNTAEEHLSFDPSSQREGSKAHAAAFATGGWISDWLVGQQAMLKLGGLVFAHGDLPSVLADWTVEEINDRVMESFRGRNPQADTELPATLFAPEASILWCREARDARSRSYAASLIRFLEANGASAYVCGHTPSEQGLFRLQYGGRYLCIDTAMTFQRHGIGRRSALVVDGEEAWAVYFVDSEPRYVAIDLSLSHDLP